MVKREKFTTPTGVLGFPCAIHEPDTKFATAEENDKGDYKARIRLPEGEASTVEFIAILQEQFDSHIEELNGNLKGAAKAKGVKLAEDGQPWGPEVHHETGEETGNILVRCKLKARVVPKKGDGKFFDQRPKVFDKAGQILVGENIPAVGAGTTAKLAGQVSLWNTPKGAGMSLWFNAVQILELVERGGSNNAEDYGFAVSEEAPEEFATAGEADKDGDF